jgi:hypothetical protein
VGPGTTGISSTIAIARFKRSRRLPKPWALRKCSRHRAFPGRLRMPSGSSAPRSECLDHVIVLSAAGLRKIVKSYVGYDMTSRTHLSLEKGLARTTPSHATGSRPSDCHSPSRRTPSPVRSSRGIDVPLGSIRRFDPFQVERVGDGAPPDIIRGPCATARPRAVRSTNLCLAGDDPRVGPAR